MFGFCLFEIGSLLCGAANTSAMFIVGRAIAGLGGAGILSGAFIIISRVVSLKRRANFSALIWAMYGIASCSGPLVGAPALVSLKADVLADRIRRWEAYLQRRSLGGGAFI